MFAIGYLPEYLLRVPRFGAKAIARNGMRRNAYAFCANVLHVAKTDKICRNSQIPSRI